MPFGEYRGTAPAINTPLATTFMSDLGFTGHQHNNDLGLVYMNARFYVPGVGKFASADTIIPAPTRPQSYNRYAYVENNPLNATDPSGHCKMVQGELGPDGEAKTLPSRDSSDAECWGIFDYLHENHGVTDWTPNYQVAQMTEGPDTYDGGGCHYGIVYVECIEYHAISCYETWCRGGKNPDGSLAPKGRRIITANGYVLYETGILSQHGDYMYQNVMVTSLEYAGEDLLKFMGAALAFAGASRDSTKASVAAIVHSSLAVYVGLNGSSNGFLETVGGGGDAVGTTLGLIDALFTWVDSNNNATHWLTISQTIIEPVYWDRKGLVGSRVLVDFDLTPFVYFDNFKRYTPPTDGFWK